MRPLVQPPVHGILRSIAVLETARPYPDCLFRGLLKPFRLRSRVPMLWFSTEALSSPLQRQGSIGGLIGWSFDTWTLREHKFRETPISETQETLERQRAFDELFEELLPVYGEAEAEAQTEDLLGYTRPLRRSSRSRRRRTPSAFIPRSCRNLTSHGSDVWACTTQGVASRALQPPPSRSRPRVF